MVPSVVWTLAGEKFVVQLRLRGGRGFKAFATDTEQTLMQASRHHPVFFHGESVGLVLGVMHKGGGPWGSRPLTGVYRQKYPSSHPSAPKKTTTTTTIGILTTLHWRWMIILVCGLMGVLRFLLMLVLLKLVRICLFFALALQGSTWKGGGVAEDYGAAAQGRCRVFLSVPGPLQQSIR